MKLGKGEKEKPMRVAMPTVAAWVDDLRYAFGEQGINRAIGRGVQGEPDQFHAVEGGNEVGTPFCRGHVVRIAG